MHSQPKISIITPLYNKQVTIKRLYNSIVKQTVFEQLEWIIVDDGSTDDSVNVIKSAVDECSPNVKVYSTSNNGKHKAILFGLQKSMSNYIIIIDADDYLSKVNAIELLFKNLNALSEERCAGLIFPYKDLDGKYLGNKIKGGAMYPLVAQLKLTGDKGRLFDKTRLDTNLLNGFDDEKFFPELIFWLSGSPDDYFYGVDDALVCVEYLPTGLSANYSSLIFNSPKGIGLLLNLLWRKK